MAARRVGSAVRLVVLLLALILVANGCQARDRSIPAATGPLIAYTVPKTTPWFQDGDVEFVLTQGQTVIKTWTKHVDSSRFGGFGRPAFTADGKYAFTAYAVEEAGRYPYDGGDIHAEVAWMDVATGQTHEAAIAAQSRTATQPPSRPGEPYALQGSTVVWQAPSPANAPDGQVTLMQLDLSQPNPQPSILRTVQLPPRTPAQQAVPYRDQDFTGNVIGADSLETWSRGLRLFDAERAKHDPAQFYDLDYGALVSDPVAAVADIYRHFGIELTDDARAAIVDTDEQSKQGPRAPKHTYSLADYGLTADQVRDTFTGL